MDYLTPQAAIDDGILQPMNPMSVDPYGAFGLGAWHPSMWSADHERVAHRFDDPLSLAGFPGTESPLIPSDIDTPTVEMFMPRLGGLSSVSDMVSVFSLVDYLTGK